MQFHTRQRRLSILIIWSEVFLSVDRNGFIDWRSICLFFCLQMFSVDLTEPHYSWRKVTDTNGTTPSPRNKHSCWVHRDRSAPPLGSTSLAFPLSKVLDSYPEPESPHLPHSIIAQIKLFSAFQELNCLGMCCRDPGLNSDLRPFAAFLFWIFTYVFFCNSKCELKNSCMFLSLQVNLLRWIRM